MPCRAELVPGECVSTGAEKEPREKCVCGMQENEWRDIHGLRIKKARFHNGCRACGAFDSGGNGLSVFYCETGRKACQRQ